MLSLQLNKSEIKTLRAAVENYIDYVYADTRRTGKNISEGDAEDLWNLRRRLSKLSSQDEDPVEVVAKPLQEGIW